MIITVNVTQGHIAAGHRCSGTYCPVALAIDGMFDMATCCTVNQKSVNFESRRGDVLGWQVNLPPQAIEFITRFDHQKLVQPFSFDLEIPESLANHLEKTIP